MRDLMPVARRHVLAALMAVLTAGTTGVVAVASGQQTAAEASGGKDPVAAGPASTTAGSIVQIVAHPDDDLFFMNPDLSRSLAAGTRLTTTYLTSGESDGRNEARGATARDPVQPADRTHYAEARQNGIRAAYAQMATGDRTSVWKRTVIPTLGGAHAELDVLVAKPEINLVFLQLREARSPSGDNPESLHGLWNGRIPALGALLTAGTPVKQEYTYTKDQLTEAIAGILERYKPTTIRMQDPTPGRYEDTGKYTDHQDHMYGARFVQAATARYALVKDRPRFSVQSYLGYHNGTLPHALDPESVEAKVGFLKTYAWLDHENYCGSPSGCGDRKVAGSPTGRNWAQSLRYARADSTSWLAEGAAGRLWAFAAVDGQMGVWERERDRWTGPALLPGTGIDPGATTAGFPDGRLAVLATRTVFGDRGQDYRREVVYAVQSAPGGPFGEWRSLGTPEREDEHSTSAISGPSAAVDADGRMTVYVRDARRTLRARVQQPDGTFTDWQRLGGWELQSDPATVVDSAGRRHVYVSNTRSVLAWIQATPGAPVQGPFPTHLPATTVPLTAARDGAGIRLYFRRPDSGVVRSALVTAGSGKPSVSRINESGGRAGYGAVSVAGRLLTGRADTGTVGTTTLGGPPAWTQSQMLYAGAPSAVLDPAGVTTTAVLGLDAELHVSTTPPASTAHATWHRAVPRRP
ncbi:PIG-L family deacetylase [Streptomyces sp. ISL-86]|uniref:PIG-L family deacetylase n=1 Tax=Streptomyces sp. ISL-86 TaxID=2819187 RepID=UPI0020361C4D|nr:PIG-L family deacetylase [Streptomyces sp. ISL-86]